jgi:hypothetical protein
LDQSEEKLIFLSRKCVTKKENEYIRPASMEQTKKEEYIHPTKQTKKN